MSAVAKNSESRQKGKKETGWDQCFLRGHWARSHDSRAKEN